MNRCITLLAICLAVLAKTGAEARDKAIANPFFGMDTCLRDGKHKTPDSRAAVLAELGYSGYGSSGVKGIPEVLKALDARGLELFTLYVGAMIDAEKEKYDPGLKDAIQALKGRKTFLWLYVRSRQHRPSSPEGDEQAVKVIREIGDMAAEAGLQVALYPHTGFWVERVHDAVRVAKKVDRKNVGATFNLCHWLKVDRGKDLEPLLKDAIPHLFVVSINGADGGGGNWKQLIQPLDSGSYDVGKFLMALSDVGFTGPIGLQGYGVPGDSRENLRRSMQAWKKLSGGAGTGWIEFMKAEGLSAWRAPTADWLVTGEVFMDSEEKRKLVWKPGTGIIVNGPKGHTRNLLTKMEHADIEAHVEFMVPEGSNSGVYFQGRYEIQVLDSWGVDKPKHGDCGGIYQRWQNGKGFEGRPPRVNAARKPGEWQTFDVIFRAPRFDASGKKIKNAVFVKVVHNGVVVHENQEVTGPTRAATYNDEKPVGPLMFQGDHGPVAYRNVRIRRLEDE